MEQKFNKSLLRNELGPDQVRKGEMAKRSEQHKL